MLTILENDEIRVEIKTSGLNHKSICTNKKTGKVVYRRELKDVPLIRIITVFQENGYKVIKTKFI